MMVDYDTAQLLKLEKYWDKVTEDTAIEWLVRRSFFLVRTGNILIRGAIHIGGGKFEYKPIKTVKELLATDEEDLKRYRNMGKKSLEDIENFKQTFLAKSNVQKLHNPISEQGQSDWLDGYKVGFRDGVIAVQKRAKEKIDEIGKELTD